MAKKMLNLSKILKMRSTIYVLQTGEYDPATNNTEIWIEKHKIMGLGQYAHGGYFWINENDKVVQYYDGDIFYNTLSEAKQAALILYIKCKEEKETYHCEIRNETYRWGGILPKKEICFKPQPQDTWWICPTYAAKKKYNI